MHLQKRKKYSEVPFLLSCFAASVSGFVSFLLAHQVLCISLYSDKISTEKRFPGEFSS